MRRACIVVFSAGIFACTPSGQHADTMSLATVDTVKPLDTNSVTAAGATAAAQPNPAGTVKQTSPTTSQSKTTTKKAPRDTTELGYDRAIPINTKDPKVRLPTVDTTKRPPK